MSPTSTSCARTSATSGGTSPGTRSARCSPSTTRPPTRTASPASSTAAASASAGRRTGRRTASGPRPASPHGNGPGWRSCARDRRPAEEVEWRTLSWIPDFADPVAAPRLAGALAAMPYAVNAAANAAINAETDARTLAAERAICARVTAPVVIVHGAADPRPSDGVKELAAALPRAELTLLDGAGHHPWQERPDEVRAVLRELVGAVER
ncbi:hypothetical protein BJF78_29260 [Pseudonocardia sp. CNS-139]|nr:hypothetical protein BJF78_29260 [Pseudonocardia sp. CNS-139]